MPPIYFVETREQQRNVVEGSPAPKFRTIVTRYYTEFDPDPQTVLNRLQAPVGSDGLPSIFYDIENKSGLPTGSYKWIPSATGIKPLSIEVQPGYWARRVDWTVKWEELLDVQEPLSLLGLTIYEWRRTTDFSEEASEVLVGHRLFADGDSDSAGYLTKLRTNKPVYGIVGKVAGEIDYGAVRIKIAQNTSVVGFSYAYNPVTDITDVQIRLEEAESEDAVNG